MDHLYLPLLFLDLSLHFPPPFLGLSTAFFTSFSLPFLDLSTAFFTAFPCRFHCTFHWFFTAFNSPSTASSTLHCMFYRIQVDMDGTQHPTENVTGWPLMKVLLHNLGTRYCPGWSSLFQ